MTNRVSAVEYARRRQEIEGDSTASEAGLPFTVTSQNPTDATNSRAEDAPSSLSARKKVLRNHGATADSFADLAMPMNCPVQPAGPVAPRFLLGFRPRPIVKLARGEVTETPPVVVTRTLHTYRRPSQRHGTRRTAHAVGNIVRHGGRDDSVHAVAGPRASSKRPAGSSSAKPRRVLRRDGPGEARRRVVQAERLGKVLGAHVDHGQGAVGQSTEASVSDRAAATLVRPAPRFPAGILSSLAYGITEDF